MDELEAALEEGYPRLLYWLGHATPEYLMLGDERIAPGDLRNLLRSFDDRERPEGMLAFLNACQTAEAGSGGLVPGRAAQLRLHRGDRHRAADDRQLRQRVRPGVPARVPPRGQAAGRAAARRCGWRRPRWACSTAPTARPRSGSRSGDDARAPGAVADPRERPGRRASLLEGTVRSAATGVATVACRAPVAAHSARAAVPLAGLLRRGGPRPVHRPRRRRRAVRRDAGPARHADPDPARRERHRQELVPPRRGDPLPGGGVRRLPVLPPARRLGADHPGRQGPGRRSWPRPCSTPRRRRCATTRRTASRITVDLRRVLDEALGTPADYATLREALRARSAPAGGRPGPDGGPAAARPGPGPRPGRGGLHAGPDPRGGRQPRPRPADAPAPGRRAGRREADRLAADRVLRPAAGPPPRGPARPDRRARRPAPRLLPVRPDRGDRAADVRDAAGRRASRRPARNTASATPRASPRQIADGVLALRSENQDSVLPLVQVICTQLYEREKAEPGTDGVITREDLDAIKGVEGGLRAFAEDALVRSMRSAPRIARRSRRCSASSTTASPTAR